MAPGPLVQFVSLLCLTRKATAYAGTDKRADCTVVMSCTAPKPTAPPGGAAFILQLMLHLMLNPMLHLMLHLMQAGGGSWPPS